MILNLVINIIIKKTINDFNMNNFKRLNEVQSVKMLKGIFRRTLCFNNELMLCHFILKKDAELPVHKHKEHQVGYVIKGKMKFITEKGDFIVQEGDSYIFQSNEKHGAIIIEDSEVIDVFNPSRVDYL
jgi:quercetin dioxygenase-like cupin family protein